MQLVTYFYHATTDFITSSNVDSLISQGTFDYVVDAADGVSDKAAIVHQCVVTETPVVCSGGVGGLLDPSLLLTSDLATAKGVLRTFLCKGIVYLFCVGC